MYAPRTYFFNILATFMGLLQWIVSLLVRQQNAQSFISNFAALEVSELTRSILIGLYSR